MYGNYPPLVEIMLKLRQNRLSNRLGWIKIDVLLCSIHPKPIKTKQGEKNTWVWKAVIICSLAI